MWHIKTLEHIMQLKLDLHTCTQSYYVALYRMFNSRNSNEHISRHECESPVILYKALKLHVCASPSFFLSLTVTCCFTELNLATFVVEYNGLSFGRALQKDMHQFEACLLYYCSDIYKGFSSSLFHQPCKVSWNLTNCYPSGICC